MRAREPLASARIRILVAFALTLLLPAIALVCVAARQIYLDRIVAAKEAEDRRGNVADLATADLQRTLATVERQLSSGESDTLAGDQADSVIVTIAAGRVSVETSGRLFYLPFDTASAFAAPDDLLAAEALEFRGDRDAAALAYRRVAARSSADVRGEALIRLGRTLRSLQQFGEADRVYGELSELRAVLVAGVPADLLALRAKAALYDQTGQRDRLADAARALRQALVTGRRAIDVGTFQAYLDQADRWLGDVTPLDPDRLALTTAVEAFVAGLSERRLAASGRSTTTSGNRQVTTVWQSSASRLAALFATPSYVTREWIHPVAVRLQDRGMALTVRLDTDASARSTPTDAARRRLQRTTAETGLPWPFEIQDTDPAPDNRARERTMIAGLLLLVGIIALAGYFTARAVSRELAVVRLQADFVSAVSHEFRTPLTSLRQFTSLLADEEEPGPEKRRTFYQAQARAAERLEHLVDTLLDFGRMEAGARPYRLEPMLVADFVNTTVDAFSREGLPRDFTIERAPMPSPLAIDADATALARALRNLLENAVKYSGDGRRIAIGVTANGPAIGISVADEGLGIDPADRARIFDKFVRGLGSRVHGIPGTGLGLAMVQHIVTAHGGRVTVESEPGRGSTFTIWLPATETAVSVRTGGMALRRL